MYTECIVVVVHVVGGNFVYIFIISGGTVRKYFLCAPVIVFALR